MYIRYLLLNGFLIILMQLCLCVGEARKAQDAERRNHEPCVHLPHPGVPLTIAVAALLWIILSKIIFHLSSTYFYYASSI